MNIGLLMNSHEDDILPDTLAANCQFVDCFYALDGTVPNDVSQEIIRNNDKCAGYITDAETGYGKYPRDGWRQKILEMAVADHGADHWFLLLHGDEVWTGLPDLELGHDGYIFQLPFFFPREGEPWDDDLPPLEQLHWHLGPGASEFRMFKGRSDVSYNFDQHACVHPAGLKDVGVSDLPIYHYLYRSPDVQRERALRHEETRFDLSNYQHIVKDDAVYWTDDMIAGSQQHSFYGDLRDLKAVAA